MDEVHVPARARRLHEASPVRRNRVRVEGPAGGGGREREARVVAPRGVAWADAFGVGVLHVGRLLVCAVALVCGKWVGRGAECIGEMSTHQMSRHGSNAVRAQHCSPTVRQHVREQRRHQQALLGAIEVMHKVIPVNMPPLQILALHRLALPLGRAQIDNHVVRPQMPVGARLADDLLGVVVGLAVAAARGDALLAAAQLGDVGPGLGRKVVDVDGAVEWHVGALARPGALVGRVEAQPRPEVLRPLGDLRAREAVLDAEVAVLEEELLLLLGEAPGGGVFGGGHGERVEIGGQLAMEGVRF